MSFAIHVALPIAKISYSKCTILPHVHIATQNSLKKLKYMSTETPQTQTTSDTTQKQINISFDGNGALNYNFSNNLTLSEIIGSFVIVGAGLLSKTFPNEVLHAIYDKVSQLPVVSPSEEHFTMPHYKQPEDFSLPTLDVTPEMSALQKEWKEFQSSNS